MSESQLKTFAEIQAEIRAQEQNSDLSNLAFAARYVEEALDETSALKARILDAVAQVEQGKSLPAGTVQKLYKASQGLR